MQRISLILAAIGFALVSSAFAAVRLVPHQYQTIQAAINAAEDGDTVRVSAGQYVELLTVNKSLNFIGNTNHPEEFIIDGNDQNCAIRIGSELHVTMEGFTVQNGRNNPGGGISSGPGSDIKLYNVIVTNNENDGYGHGGGGGLAIGGTLEMNHCTVRGNTAFRGGGLSLGGEGASAHIYESVFEENSTSGYGGAIWVHQTARLFVQNTIFRGNYAASSGGAISISQGGDYREGYAQISHCLFCDNTSGGHSSAIVARDYSFDVINCTFTNNISAENVAVGLYNIPSANFSNCIFWNQGDEFKFLNGNVNLEINYSDIEDGQNSIDNDANGSLVFGEDNIDSDPLFVDPDNGDFHLQANSPCIDAGDPNSPEDPDGTRADMGAFYFHQEPHCIPFFNGWNLISSAISPDNPNHEAVWRDIVTRGHLTLVKDQIGWFYSPRYNYNGLPDWDVRQGYQARVTAPDTLVIPGVFVDPQTVIPLRNVWNFVSYFPRSPQTEREAFANIRGDLLMVKDEWGRFYNIEWDYSNMVLLHRGKGYQVKIRRPCDLVWNVPEEGMRSAECGVQSDVESDDGHYKPATRTGRNMSVLLEVQSVKCKVQNAELSIGAFTEGGLCVGASVCSIFHFPFSIGLAVWGDDPATPELDGAREGEALQFRLWDGAREHIIQPQVLEGEAVYHTDGFLAVSLREVSLPAAFAINGVYPNPFNNAASVRFSLDRPGRVTIKLFDLNGREALSILDQSLEAGSHSIMIDASSLPSQVYICRMVDEWGRKAMVKAVVIK